MDLLRHLKRMVIKGDNNRGQTQPDHQLGWTHMVSNTDTLLPANQCVDLIIRDRRQEMLMLQQKTSL